MEFSKIEISKSVDELDEDGLREAVSKFADANEKNEAVFSELREELENTPELPEEVQEYMDETVEVLVEETSFSEEQLGEFSFSALVGLEKELLGDGKKFRDMGEQKETHPEEENVNKYTNAARERLGEIVGLNVE